MLKVNFLVEPHYPVDRKLVRSALQIATSRMNLKTDAEMTVSVIGDRKMRSLNNFFRSNDKTTNVLSFNPTEVEKIPHFPVPKTQVLYLGDVAISYPVALAEALKENVMVDERIAFLATHGLLHLFGYDHEQPEEARTMEEVEDWSMRQLKIPEIIK